MPTRSARTRWNGGLQDGSGTVELASSGVGSYPVSFPRRAADEAEGEERLHLLHETRKRAKAVRYAAEALADLVTRRRNLLVSGVAAVGLMTVAGLGTGIGAALVTGDGRHVGEVTLAHLNHAPAPSLLNA